MQRIQQCLLSALVASSALILVSSSWEIRAGDPEIVTLRNRPAPTIPSDDTLAYIEQLRSKHSVHSLTALVTKQLPLEHLFTLEQLSESGGRKLDATKQEERLIFLYPLNTGYLTQERQRILSQFPNIYAYEFAIDKPRCIVTKSWLTSLEKGRPQLNVEVSHYVYHDRIHKDSPIGRSWRLVKRCGTDEDSLLKARSDKK